MILNPFNSVYFGLLIAIVAIIVVLTLIFKNKSDAAREGLIIGISIFNLIFYVVYKFLLYVRTPGLPDEYLFVPLKELPLHLCNISLILLPISVKLKFKSLMGYGFFVAPLGAFFALSFPSDGFYNVSIFAPHMIGYYGTHAIIIITGMLLLTLGIYKPHFKEIPKLILLCVILSAVVFGINLLIFHTTGVRANYFYTVTPEGISILELFWSWLPIPYLYISFAMLILFAYIAIIMIPITIVRAVKGDTVDVEE